MKYKKGNKRLPLFNAKERSDPVMEYMERYTEHYSTDNCFAEPTARVVATGGALHLLELSGRQAPGWIGRLGTGLASLNVNILRGRAVKKSALEWSAWLELDFFEATREADKIDYLRMAADTLTPPGSYNLTLESFKLSMSNKHNGSLHVEICGSDRIGFLASLLNMYSLYSLHPVEIEIETRDKKIHDRFWLKGMGGVIPSESSVSAVSDRLSVCRLTPN